MPDAAKVNRLSVAEYLEGELRSPVKHEYVDGQVFAMTGVSRRHNLINGNFYAALREHLAGRPPCQVYFTDVKVRIEAANSFYYPDLAVTCDPRDTDPYIVTHPLLIVEIISPSTETIDRREKLTAYQRLDSLKEYILVEQQRQEVCLYRRDATGQWWQVNHYQGDVLALESVGLNLPLATLYAGAGI